MLRGLLHWLVLLPAAAQGTEHGSGAGPRAAIAGLGGFTSVSRMDFREGSNHLTATYVFPDRVRWTFEAEDPTAGRQVYYRQGQVVQVLVSGQASQPLAEEARDVVVMQMELRRAVMMWPDGFDWEGEGERRTAPVHADSCCRKRPLGVLVAQLSGGRPVRVEARDDQGEQLEALEIRAWQEIQGRTWPRVLALEGEGGFVESIESLETRVRFLEEAFVPPDRRLSSGEATRGDVLAQDLVAMTYTRRTLARGTEWSQALAKAREWMLEETERLRPQGITLDDTPTFELTPEGHPGACLLRLARAVSPPPEGYVTQPERSGLLVARPGLEDVDALVLKRLTGMAPSGARPGTPYLRVHSRTELPVEVVLPLEADG